MSDYGDVFDDFDAFEAAEALVDADLSADEEAAQEALAALPGAILPARDLGLALQLAATFERAERIDALFAPKALTILQAPPEMIDPLGTVIRNGFIPAHVTCLGRNMDARRSGSNLRIATLTDRSDLSDLLAKPEPILLLCPQGKSAPLNLSGTPPLRVASFNRQIAVAQVLLTYADAASVTALLTALPDDAALSDISPLAWAFAFRARSAAEALSRLDAALPRPVAGAPSLDTIRGEGIALSTARRMVADLLLWKDGKVAWSELTRSLLFYGAPGTGKTHLARAMGVSANVPFFQSSLAEWQAAGHLGDMLAAMRETFAKACADAPSILFLDEIDAAGSRFDRDRHGRTYHRQVVTGLLEEIDKAARTEGVLLIGATNDRAAIDPALLRPGRFDLHLEMPLPDAEALLGILQTHCDHGEADLRPLARQAIGLTAADLDAAIRSSRSEARANNRPWQPADLSPHLNHACATPDAERRIALHECGHAIVFDVLELGTIERILIRHGDGGEVHTTATRPIHTVSDYDDQIAYMLAGRAAEALILGEVSSGAGGTQASDLAQATRLAIAIETRLGLGHHEQLWLNGTDEAILRNPAVYAKVRKRLETAEARAEELLKAQRDRLEAAARALCERRELGEQELARLLSANSDRRSQSLRSPRGTNEVAPFA
ncbi:MAG: AAA family ATPase [Thioclava sp.]|nr:AAA family ATPase [Thioclava sp.]MBD3803456.1 AAA family ATPase [Thioclava sp.]